MDREFQGQVHKKPHYVGIKEVRIWSRWVRKAVVAETCKYQREAAWAQKDIQYARRSRFQRPRIYFGMHENVTYKYQNWGTCYGIRDYPLIKIEWEIDDRASGPRWFGRQNEGKVPQISARKSWDWCTETNSSITFTVVKSNAITTTCLLTSLTLPAVQHARQCHGMDGGQNHSTSQSNCCVHELKL